MWTPEVTDRGGLSPNPFLYKILDVIANIVRSIPFLILLILLILLVQIFQSVGMVIAGRLDKRK